MAVTSVLPKKNVRLEISEGSPYPLGATVTETGVNFSLFSQHSTKVELCLFDSPEASEPVQVIELPYWSDHIWHAHVASIQPGQIYGYRVHGPYEPEAGQRFNPHKIVLDPYAKSIARRVHWDNSVFGYDLLTTDDSTYGDTDSSAFAPLARVAQSDFNWEQDKAPRTPWRETVIYETHLKGITATHPDIPEKLRGTYLGMAQSVIVEYLKQLGITAVEVLPVQHFVDDSYLEEKGLSNYWGYNTLAFLAPEPKYVAKDSELSDIDQFKTMAKAYHEAGIEVIMDVVYNHSGEGNHFGPTLYYRGVDNSVYYRLTEDPRYYFDTTGCGNSFNVNHPVVLQLFMDSLRYWVLEMHVDGFRFDLASTLARDNGYFDMYAAFFKTIRQDPVLNQVKLIAEPWDLDGDGYQLGHFPLGWAEWNGFYRDTIRSFWKGDEGKLADFADCFTGSNHIFGHYDRQLYASVNFVSCHDGFTLKDLVSYNEKHNDANGEENRDGSDHNISWNCGAEGDTEDPEIIALRQQQMRNLLATTILSLGVPMICGGDEMARTQQGNNNTYCQDSDIAWYNWATFEENKPLYDFVCKVVALRKENPIFKREAFFHGELNPKKHDVEWFNPDGLHMETEHWTNPAHKALGFMINGKVAITTDSNPEVQELPPASVPSVILLFNAHYEAIEFTLPNSAQGYQWHIYLDTCQDSEKTDGQVVSKNKPLTVAARSMMILKAVSART